MANYATLKAAITDVIKTNGTNAITGALLQSSLLALIDSLGAGYQFVGVATPSTNPGTPDQNVFYLAATAGTYSNFGGIVLDKGDVAVLKYNGTWAKQSVGAISNEAIQEYSNIVNSGKIPVYSTDKNTLIGNGANNQDRVLFDSGVISSGVPAGICFSIRVGNILTDYPGELAHLRFYNGTQMLANYSLAANTQKDVIVPENTNRVVIKYYARIGGTSTVGYTYGVENLYCFINDSYAISQQKISIDSLLGLATDVANNTEQLGKKILFGKYELVGNGVMQQMQVLFSVNSTNIGQYRGKKIFIDLLDIVSDFDGRTGIQINLFNSGGGYISRNSFGITGTPMCGYVEIPNDCYRLDVRFYASMSSATTVGYTYSIYFNLIFDGYEPRKFNDISQKFSEIEQEISEIEQEISGIETEEPRWKNKNVVVWGDSITAQGNGDNPGTGSFFYWAKLKHIFANLFQRGVGGQSYIWNASGWYTGAGMNGNYLGRYNYDAQGNRLDTVVSPETTTQAEINNIQSKYNTTIEIHYGCFCSWDRIKSMIPASIRESIDLVVLCGGTNDHSAVEDVDVQGDIVINEPEWVPNSTTDPTWANDLTYYKGGDYDITTFVGAIASTIMKMQTWCPNAIIVVATPFPRFNLVTKQQYVNTHGVSFRELCEIELAAAQFVGANIIDSNGKCNINGVNFSDYQTDGVHPNEAGRKMFGNVFCGELYRITPKIQ